MEKVTSKIWLNNILIKFALIVICGILLFGSSTYSQYKRNVVFEEFSEVWCGPCAALTPMLTQWIENHPDYIPIVYYSYFMDNGKQFFNSTIDYNQRKNFYKVPFYPYARINADVAPNDAYPGFPTDTTVINSMIDTMSKTTPVKIKIDFINNGATGKINIDLTSEVNLTNKRMYVMLVEKYHKYSAQSNGLSEFHHLFRDMLPNQYGQLLSIDAGKTINFSYNYTLDKSLNFDLFATVIVQDTLTNYIYQAESVFKPATPLNVEDYKTDHTLLVFPNPVSENIGISLNNLDEYISKIELFDLLGSLISTIDTKRNINKLSMESVDSSGQSLRNGVYYIKVTTANHIYFEKFEIVR